MFRVQQTSLVAIWTHILQFRGSARSERLAQNSRSSRLNLQREARLVNSTPNLETIGPQKVSYYIYIYTYMYICIYVCIAIVGYCPCIASIFRATMMRNRASIYGTFNRQPEPESQVWAALLLVPFVLAATVAACLSYDRRSATLPPRRFNALALHITIAMAA